MVEELRVCVGSGGGHPVHKWYLFWGNSQIPVLFSIYRFSSYFERGGGLTVERPATGATSNEPWMSIE